jgi:hypothetical protein
VRLSVLTAVVLVACGNFTTRPPLAEPDPSPSDTSGADAGTPAAPLAAERTLFVGNSFTYTNDLPGIYDAIAKTLAANAPVPYVDSIAYGSYTLAQHLADAQGTGPNPRLSTLIGASAGGAKWNHVLLQEQSEIPGLPATNPELPASMTAAVGLARYVVATGATPVLFMTWGFPNGDPVNPTIYPDYPTMQSLLEAGYRAMAHAVAAAGMPVAIAPAGLAFKAVRDREVAAGRDPNASTSLFSQLYGPDAKHPAPPGTYVTACVVVGTIYGVDPTTITDGVAGLTPDTKAVLRAIARDVVAAERARPAP